MFGGGEGSIPLPSGAIGVWYMDQFLSRSNRVGVVRNAASAVPAYQTMLPVSRRLYANVWGMWAKTGGVSTVSDNDALAFDGTNTASTFTVTGGASWGVYASLLGTGPSAGTYTIGCNVRLVSGDGRFKIGQPFGSQWSSEFTATSSWQRFSFTFSWNGVPFPGFGIGTNNASVGTGVFEISSIEMFPGSSDLGPESFGDAHMCTYSSSTSNVTFSNGLVSFQDAVGFGYIDFLNQYSTSTVTAVAVTKPLSGFNPRANPYHTWLSGFEDDSLFIGNDVPNKPGIGLGPAGAGGNTFGGEVQLMPYFFECEGAPLAAFAHRWDGVAVESWVNGAKVLTKPFSFPDNPGYSRLYAATLAHTGSHPNFNAYSSIALWSRALSDNEVLTAMDSLKQRALRFNPVPATRWCFVLGDQIAARKFPYLSAMNVTDKVRGANYGATAATVTSIDTTVSRILSIKSETDPLEKMICIVNVGRNNLGSNNATATAASLATRCDTLRAAGIQVVVCTLIDSTVASQAQFDSDRAAFNSIVSGWVGSHADAIANLAGVSGMGANGDRLNATNFTSGITPTDVGDALLEPTLTAVLNALP